MTSEIETPNATWVLAAQGGDRAAFGLLVQCYQQAVFAQCRRLALNRTDAEDLAHDTFVQAFTQIRQVRDPDRFGSWLKTIALNLYRAALRQQYQKMLPLESDSAAPITAAVNQQWQQVEENLWRLSPAQRLVLALHYCEGLSYDQIARFTDVPLGTVMSRLHRARQNLKDRANENEEYNGETDMNSTPDLTKEIDAEITALGRLFAEDPDSMERLSVLLRHSPARFAQLIAEMAPAELDPLVALLQRLGTPAMAVALDCYFSGDDLARQRALSLIEALIAQDQDWHVARNWSDGTILTHITQTTYALLDQIISRPVPDTEKVELLLLLANAASRPGFGLISELCWKVMLSYPQLAFGFLLEQLEATTDISIAQPLVEMRIFVRFGTPSCRQILTWLDEERGEHWRLGLAGFVALAGWLNPRGPGGLESRQERGDVHFRDHWVLLNKDLDPDILNALSKRASTLASHDDAQVREAAMLALGAIRRADPIAIEALCHCLDHHERPTRLAALNALGEIGISDHQNPALAAVEMHILSLAEVDHRAEQIAALTALGRLHFESARPLLTQQAETATNAEVREAAVNGLGQIGGEESAALLRRLQISGSKDLRKKASRWLQRLEKSNKERPSPTQLARQKRVAHFRGEQKEDVSFPFHRFHINLGGAIRSLPEVRSYPEIELTRYFAQICADYSFTRRVLADRGLLHREEGICTLTEAGQRVWRVEHFISDCYLGDKPA
ncbi:MAG: sigma-70 family RNA polymerase sigma factor [Candidatus Latescibacterota bacterium]|jgi:RNA polymerase sigma-70 factor (ECF subfamily)